MNVILVIFILAFSIFSVVDMKGVKCKVKFGVKAISLTCKGERDCNVSSILVHRHKSKPVGKVLVKCLVFKKCRNCEKVKSCTLPRLLNHGIFNLSALSELNIRCHLQSIEDDAFDHTRLLTKLLLSNTDFHRIPSAICRIKKLKTLEIADSKLTEIATELQYMPELVNLSLTKNRISSILGSAFMGDLKLQSIVLTNNKLRSLDNKTFDPCLSLRLVKLDQNDLVTVDGLFQNPSLMVIFLIFLILSLTFYL
nr:protein toll-like [Parasteatoda tepidariorum]